jgi:hypothetical protein
LVDTGSFAAVFFAGADFFAGAVFPGGAVFFADAAFFVATVFFAGVFFAAVLFGAGTVAGGTESTDEICPVRDFSGLLFSLMMTIVHSMSGAHRFGPPP